MDPDEELPLAWFEGWFTRLNCEACGDVFEVESDVSNNEVINCGSCGVEVRVGGR